MPANLTAQYKNAEAGYRAAETPQEKLKALREMLATIPKHKGTEKMQSELKRRISTAQEEAQTKAKGGGKKAAGQHVKREGAGQVLILGPTNAGKSAIMAALTRATPEIAPYPFTTRMLQPGMMPWNNVFVQLVDAPAFSRESSESWMSNSLRYADAFIIAVDVCSDDPSDQVRGVVEKIREQKIEPCAVLPGFGAEDEEEDALFDSRTQYKRAVIAANKMDLLEADFWLNEMKEELGEGLPVFPVSAESKQGIEDLRNAVFGLLGVIRAYTKPPGKPEDREHPFILPAGSTVFALAERIHKDLARDMKAARVWGSARFDGQSVEKTHVLADEDVVEIKA